MSKQPKSFPGSAMPAEEAEETFSRGVFPTIKESYIEASPYSSQLRLDALVYGSSVSSATRKTQLCIRSLLSETEGNMRKPSDSSLQLMGKRRTCSEKLSFRLSGLKQRVLSCGLRILAKPKVWC